MEALYLLIPVSLGLATFFVVACVVAIRLGQFDELDSPKWRLLMEGDGGLRPAFIPAAQAENSPAASGEKEFTGK